MPCKSFFPVARRFNLGKPNQLTFTHTAHLICLISRPTDLKQLIALYLAHLFHAAFLNPSALCSTSFSFPEDQILKRNTLLTTLDPQSFNLRDFAQILQLTIGGKSGNVGDRTFERSIHKFLGVQISTTLNGKPNVGKLFRTKKPPINEWTVVG